MPTKASADEIASLAEPSRPPSRRQTRLRHHVPVTQARAAKVARWARILGVEAPVGLNMATSGTWLAQHAKAYHAALGGTLRSD